MVKILFWAGQMGRSSTPLENLYAISFQILSILAGMHGHAFILFLLAFFRGKSNRIKWVTTCMLIILS